MRQKKRLTQIVRAAVLISKWNEEAAGLDGELKGNFDIGVKRQVKCVSATLKACAVELERALLTEKPIR